MKKHVFYTELAYVFGILSLVFGVTFMERADFGLSMVVAPAYVLHRYFSTLPGMGWFSFGVAEYTLQLILVLVLMMVVRRFRISYFFSFVTAVIYGYLLDLSMWLMPAVGSDQVALRIFLFILGELFCTLGVSLVFHTYIPPEAYELFVSETAKKFNQPTGRVKWVYDIVSCLTAIGLSFLFFGFGVFVGVKWGTVLCAVINGVLISALIKWEDKLFAFQDAFKWRRFFEK
ncbi:DUF6198 family protein [Ruminococcus sp.]|uniref:DUF6198 family protein n=1 Tax=Ruminococcus sp. TaxID=41978 RepID=UPI00388E7CDC